MKLNLAKVSGCVAHAFSSPLHFIGLNCCAGASTSEETVGVRVSTLRLRGNKGDLAGFFLMGTFVFLDAKPVDSGPGKRAISGKICIGIGRHFLVPTT